MRATRDQTRETSRGHNLLQAEALGIARGVEEDEDKEEIKPAQAMTDPKEPHRFRLPLRLGSLDFSPRRSSHPATIYAEYSDYEQDITAKVTGRPGSDFRPAQRCQRCRSEKQM